VPEPLPFSDAAALFEEVRLGRDDIRNVPGYPMLVVDIDEHEPGGGSDLAPATGWPVVVVGVGSASSPVPPVRGPDILLTETPNAEEPWVSVSDGVDKALLELRDAVSHHPQASTTLVQVLRSTERSTVEGGLVTESLAYAALQGGREHRDWLARLSRPSPDQDSGPCVLVERDNSTLRVALNRPSRRNAYSAKMRDELIDALALAAADETIDRVQLRGNGRSFCSGGDLAEFGSVEDTASAHWIRMHRSAGWWLHRLKHKAVAYVHGTCVGAGVELPAFAGTVVANPETSFALPEVRMGLIPGAGGTASIPRRIGRQRTCWLALTGHSLGSEVALGWGLVDRLSDGAV
jgi:hypothetical protein